MLPRGLRNNNPLNIRHGVSRWVGCAKKQSDTKFVTFCSMAMGYRAAWKLMDTYRLRLAQQGKAYTLNNIIYRWAPPEDGNDTEQYIRTVLTLLRGRVGGEERLMPPSSELGRLKMGRILAVMTCVENGIRMIDVPVEDIRKGFKLAFPFSE